jgi:hypothetical protein
MNFDPADEWRRAVEDAGEFRAYVCYDSSLVFSVVADTRD